MNKTTGPILALLPVWLLLLCLPAPSAATTSRILGLGGDGGYLEDDTNVLRWYGSLEAYPDLAILELGDIFQEHDSPGHIHQLPGHGGGLHLGLGEAWPRGTLAVYFEDDLPGDDPGGAFSILWARTFGGWQAGFYGRFTTFGERIVSSVDPDSGHTQYYHHFGFGLRHDLGPRAYLDLAGERINSRAESLAAGYHLPPTDDWGSFGLRARCFIQLGETVALVPLIDHFRDLRAGYASALPGPADFDLRNTSLGLGLNILPDADNLIVVSGEYRFGRDTKRLRADEILSPVWDIGERTFYQLRGRVGAESRILPWLGLRGAVQYIRLDDASEYRSSGVPAGLESRHIERVITPITVGCAFYLGAVTVDFIYNDSAPVNPGLISDGLLAEDQDHFTSLTVRMGF